MRAKAVIRPMLAVGIACEDSPTYFMEEIAIIFIMIDIRFTKNQKVKNDTSRINVRVAGWSHPISRNGNAMAGQQIVKYPKIVK